MPPTGKRPSRSGDDNSAEFDKFFSQQFGMVRWRQLAKAMQKDTSHVALLNCFATSAAALEGMKPCLNAGGVSFFRLSRSAAPGTAGSQPELDPHSALRTHYWMDLASAYPALLLGAGPGMAVLDAAAAPGGKTLILAHQMFSHRAKDEHSKQPGLGPQQDQLQPPHTQQQDEQPQPLQCQQSVAGEQQQQQQQGQVQCQGSGEQQPQAGPCVGESGAQGAGEQPPPTPQQGSQTHSQEGTTANTNGTVSSRLANGSPPGGATLQHNAPAANGQQGDKGGGTTHTQQPANQAKGPGMLVVNEPDAVRRTRLQRVLLEYLPHALVAGSSGGTVSGRRALAGALRVTAYEADKYWSRHESERYDRVLLDTPCSNDRHVVQQSCVQRGRVSARDWSMLQCRQLAALQLQLLLAGLRALAVGGRLVYSTCSIASLENDGVVSKALERCPPGSIRVVMPTDQDYFPASLGSQASTLQQTFNPETSKHGALLLPDSCGHGPIFVCVLEKRDTAEMTRMRLQSLRFTQDAAQEEEEEEEEDSGNGNGGEAAQS